MVWVIARGCLHYRAGPGTRRMAFGPANVSCSHAQQARAIPDFPAPAALTGMASTDEHGRGPGGAQRAGLGWGPLAILAFWLLVMAVLYAIMNQVLKPAPVIVSASGELVIPRSRDGHFYVAGMVAGRPVTFLVDTGASMVVVSEKFADAAGLARGQPATFRTASGELPGRIVPGVTVSVGPASVSGVRVGVGLVGADRDMALLGQSFLSRFELVLSGDRMILRAK